MPHWVSEEIWIGPPTGTKIRTSKPNERKGLSGPRSKHRIAPDKKRKGGVGLLRGRKLPPFDYSHVVIEISRLRLLVNIQIKFFI